MKLHIDSTRCQGYGECLPPAPGLIDLDEWGYARLLVVELTGDQETAARAAVDACPNSALRLER
ncbi:ferredoxin [Streptacidiphilus pinicola]|jgi:ferredoxin|uniref:Ferredoxin n=1 Tax=Streptacidiphilus pinicola TaxID=2219663 RepID=A0A2X0K0G3_9ACTN|nr:ferredoxin [Streptacidiphilus pinicola]RAG80830.1 ferredoxin [Streptacidiphilus pinicola]